MLIRFPDLLESLGLGVGLDLPDAVSPFRGKGARPFGGTPPGTSAGNPSPVPEPGTALLMMLGLGGLAVAGRARR